MPAVASSSPLSVLVAAADLSERPAGLSEVETITLIAGLRSVPDPRRARGRRYCLRSMLLLAVGAVLAGWIRSHWTIENCLHWVRDVTEGEDHSSVRAGHGPQVMAALRNIPINIIRLRGGTNIAAAHRHFSYQPADVLNALTAA